METLASLFVMAALCMLCGGVKKPASEYFPICYRHDPDLNDCVKRVLETIRPALIKGIPELNLVPLEPLVIPRMVYEEGSGNFKFTQTNTNLRVHGLGNYQVRRVNLDLDKLKIVLDLFVPHIRMEFDYELDGKILLVPMRGKGDGIYNFTDVTTLANADLQKVKKNGEEYLQVKNLTWEIDMKDTRIQYNNLFNGDKTLGKATNDFLNENWKEATKTYKYLPEQAFGEVVKDLSNNVYKIYPYKELFPE